MGYKRFNHKPNLRLTDSAMIFITIFFIKVPRRKNIYSRILLEMIMYILGYMHQIANK